MTRSLTQTRGTVIDMVIGQSSRSHVGKVHGMKTFSAMHASYESRQKHGRLKADMNLKPQISNSSRYLLCL